MILRDYKSIFLGGFQLVKELNHLFFILHKNHNYELPEIYNDKVIIEEVLINKYNKLNENELRSELAKVLVEIQKVNHSIIKEIYDQVIYKSKSKKIKFQDLNIKVLLNTAEEMLFSDKLILAVITSCVNSDEDLNYIRETFFEDHDMSTGDLVYLFYTMEFINKNKSDYINKFLAEEIKANYIREDVYMAIYMALCEVEESSQRKELTAILSGIYGFKENLVKIGYEKEDLDNLELLMSL